MATGGVESLAVRRQLAFLAAITAVTAGTIGAQAAVTCPSIVAEPLGFAPPVQIDPNAAGGEPVSVVAPDGSITVSAHAGTTHLYKSPQAAAGAGDFAVGYSNQTINWRSTDGGASWSRVGVLPPVKTGPHSVTSTGFSDPDLAMDQAGVLYNTEINLPQVAVYSSLDDGQSWPIANPVASSGDRPWLVATEPGEVYVLTNLLITRPLLRSDDGGVTFKVVHDNAPINGKPIVDPLNPDDGLIGPIGVYGFAISSDEGATWEWHDDAILGDSTQFFGTVAADAAGNVYMAAAGGYEGPRDLNNQGEVTVAAFERATGTWKSWRLDAPAGDALWPWIVAGSEGRVAVGWLQRVSTSPQAFAVYAAVSTNALGSTVTCSDGSLREVPASWSIADASHGPIHVGGICLDGTSCNLSSGSDRRLGDFITINHDLQGRVFLVAGDTRSTNPLGGPKPVANPVFFGQASGPVLLEQPRTAAPTRCAVTGFAPPCPG
jgi:hypothetical protein